MKSKSALTRRCFAWGLVLLATLSQAVSAAERFELRSGDRVVFLGDALMEQEQYLGWMEVMLTTRFPDQDVSFRNLGWNADTPAGASRLGLSLLQAGREPAGEGWKLLQGQLELTRPTVAILGYGMASSLDPNSGGIEGFRRDYQKLIEALRTITPGVRLVMLGTIAHEPLLPGDPAAAHNNQLRAYNQAIRELAAAASAHFIALDNLKSSFDHPPLVHIVAGEAQRNLTLDGIHLNERGYILASLAMEKALLGSESGWLNDPYAEPLRQAILVKNEWWFHRSRPANMAYVFGFRKREQGQNAGEIPQFDELIAREEKRIAALRHLKPVELDPVPRATESQYAKFTQQPHPEFTVGEGLEVVLWAENPQLNKPIHMNFDERGRLWVASSETYPMIEVGQAPIDKILVLEDSNGDGVSDRSTVFAEGLLIPTGVTPGDGGVYVAQSTDLLHLTDTNGDGVADVKRRVLSGFGTEDTHHNLHTLRWGPDGRLYMNQSVYTRTDTETPHGVVRLHAGGGLRLDSGTMALDIFFRGLWNSWGHQFDAQGQSFMTDGAGFQGVAWVFPGASFRPTPNARRELDLISPGNYPKFASMEIVQDAAFPKDWQGSIVTCDFRANRVTRFSLSDDGAGFVTKQEADLLRTANPTFRPIDVKMGPDGALYIADWSNPIINHGEVDFRDARRDRWHGRIWRVSAKGAAKRPILDLGTQSTSQLLERLLSPNRYEIEQSRRLLRERGAANVAVELKAWVHSQTLPSARLEGLWLHQALNSPDEALLDSLLADPDPRIRAAATRVAGDWKISPERLGRLVQDSHPRVRLEAVRALSKQPSLPALAQALTVLNQPVDRFLDYAAWLTLNEMEDLFLNALKNGQWKPDSPAKEKQLEFALQAVDPGKAGRALATQLGDQPLDREGRGPWIELIGKAGGPAELGRLYQQMLDGGLNPDATGRGLKSLSEAQRLRKVRPAKTGGLETFLKSGQPESVQVQALALAGAWKTGNLTPTLLNLAGDASSSTALRNAAFQALRDIGGEPVAVGLTRLTEKSQPAPIRRQAVIALSAVGLGRAAKAFYEIVDASDNETEALDLWRGFLARKDASKALVNTFPDKISQMAARAGLRASREGGRNETDLIARLTPFAGLIIQPESLTPARLKEMAAEAAKQGNPQRGEFLYRRMELGCVLCHAVGGVGGQVGPDMSSIGASAPSDYIVESLLNPNAKIKEGYHSVIVETKDGEEYSGIEVNQTANELVIRTAANQLMSIPKTNVASKNNGLSLMPAGLLDLLSPQERNDLMAFLFQVGRPGEFDASARNVARVWQVLPVTHRMDQGGWKRITSGGFEATWTRMECGLGRDHTWTPVTSRVNGTLPNQVLGELASVPLNVTLTSVFVGTVVEVGKATQAAFTFPGLTTTEVWVDGQKVPASHNAEGVVTFKASLKPGSHEILGRLDGAVPLPKSLMLKSGDVNFPTL